MRHIKFKLFIIGKTFIRRFSSQNKIGPLIQDDPKGKKTVYGGNLNAPILKKSIGSLMFERLTKKDRENDIIQVNNSLTFCFDIVYFFS